MAAEYLFMLSGFINTNPMHTTSDELGAIVGAAKLAGLDWTGINEFYNYYGFGWYSLFFWIFFITDNPVVIYRVVVAVTSLWRIAIIPVSFHIQRKYLGVTCDAVTYMIAAAMPFLYSDVVGKISNEYILESVVWIAILLLCIINERLNENKKVAGVTVLLIVLITYVQTIHTRAIILTISVALALTWLQIKNRRLNQAVLSFSLIALLHWITRGIINAFIGGVFQTRTTGISNISVSVSDNIHLFDTTSWIIWGEMTVGILFTKMAVTGGMLSVCIVAFFFLLNQKHKSVDRRGNYEDIVLFVSMFCCICVFGGFLLGSWFERIYALWGTNAMGSNYAVKGFSYIRYWDAFAPPAIMVLLNKTIHVLPRRFLAYAMMLHLIFATVYSRTVLPIIRTNQNAFSPFFGLARKTWGMTLGERDYWYVILVSICVLQVFCLFLWARKPIISLVVLLSFFVVTQSNSLYSDFRTKQKTYRMIEASYVKMGEIKNQGVDVGEIYIVDERKSDNNWKLYCIAQFYFNRYSIKDGIPKSVGNQDIIISTQPLEDGFGNIGVKEYKLSDNTYWYTFMEL